MKPSRQLLARTGASLLLLVILTGLLASWISPHSPTEIHLDHKLASPSLEYPLGTDQMGRCILSRILHGTTLSVLLPLVAMLIMLILSIPLGLLAGYYGGVIDKMIMFVINILLSFPTLIIAIIIAGLLGPGLTHILLAVVCVGWVNYARVIRGLTISLKQRPFIAASRGSGASRLSLIFRHLMPNILPTVLVYIALDMAGLIMTLAGLSFLGLGSAPPALEWGTMLNDGKNYIQSAPQLLIYPGLAIAIVALASNFMAEGMRDAVESKTS